MALTFNLYRAIPAVISAIVQYFVLRTMSATNVLIIIAITIGVYMALYIAETIWNFAGVSPVHRDQRAQQEIAGLRNELKRFRGNPVEESRVRIVREKMSQLDAGGIDAVHRVLLHGEVDDHQLSALGIVWDELIKGLNAVIVKQRNLEGRPGRIFFINPELKAAVEQYFSEHPLEN